MELQKRRSDFGRSVYKLASEDGTIPYRPKTELVPYSAFHCICLFKGESCQIIWFVLKSPLFELFWMDLRYNTPRFDLTLNECEKNYLPKLISLHELFHVICEHILFYIPCISPSPKAERSELKIVLQWPLNVLWFVRNPKMPKSEL